MTERKVELVVCRGLPASGKSTWAKAWVASDVRHRARVERDALRAMMHDSVWKGHHTEQQIISAEFVLVEMLLKGRISVVVSDTNLDVRAFTGWKSTAEDLNVKFSMQDFRDVPLQVCIDRNAKRTGKEFVPVETIIRMHDQHIKGVS